jgi:HEAT repeat protein
MGARPAADRDTVVMARLGRTLLRGQDAAMRAGAARRLGERGLVSAYAWLRHALWDPSEAVRESAVDAIAALAVVQSAGELAALYAWSGPRLRRAVLRAVNRIGYRSEFDGILSLARDDPDSKVRALAARAAHASRGRS